MKKLGGITATTHEQLALVILVSLIELLCLAAVIGAAVLLNFL